MKISDITEILEDTRKYRKSHLKLGSSDPECPLCGISMGSSFTIKVRHTNGDKLEVHEECTE